MQKNRKLDLDLYAESQNLMPLAPEKGGGTFDRIDILNFWGFSAEKKRGGTFDRGVLSVIDSIQPGEINAHLQ